MSRIRITAVALTAAALVAPAAASAATDPALKVNAKTDVAAQTNGVAANTADKLAQLLKTLPTGAADLKTNAKADAATQDRLASLADKLAQLKSPPAATGKPTSSLQGGLGQIAAAALDMTSKLDDAEQQTLAAQAKKGEYAQQDMASSVQNMQHLISDIREKLGEITQAQSEITNKIWS